MDFIFEKLDWRINKDSVVLFRDSSLKESISLTENQWNIIAHRSGDWVICGNFNERALNSDEFTEIEWKIKMSRNSTFRDVYKYNTEIPSLRFFLKDLDTNLY